MTAVRQVTVEVLNPGNLFVALLDSPIVGPYPRVSRFEGREALAKQSKIEVGDVIVGPRVKIGGVVVVREEKF